MASAQNAPICWTIAISRVQSAGILHDVAKQIITPITDVTTRSMIPVLNI
ncbi:MAG: hypothetical protein ACLRP7_03495 [Christensenellales bacterium]